MRYAIVSDIHANWQAWTAVRDDFLKQEANAVVSLGDVIGYGPSPSQVYADLSRHCHNFVLGNHDAAVTGWLDLGIFNETARRAAEWTMLWLDEKSRAQMREWPLQVEGDRIMFVHAETVVPDAYGYVEQPADAKVCFDATDKSLIFLGHTHRPGVFALTPAGEIVAEEKTILTANGGARYIVNVGSVGDPRDGSQNASYCLFDDATNRIELRQVKFDCDAFLAELKLHPELEVPWFLRQRRDGKPKLARDHAINVEEIQRRAPTKRSNVKVVRYSLGGPGSATVTTAAKPVEKPQAPAAPTTTAKPGKAMMISMLVLLVVAVVGAPSVFLYFYLKKSRSSPMPVLPTAVLPASATPTSPTPTAEQRKRFELRATEAKLSGKQIVVEQKGGIPNIGCWALPDGTATWTATVDAEGEYDVEMDYACYPKGGGGGAIVLVCGKERLEAMLPQTAGWETFQKIVIGRIRLPSGSAAITVKSGKNRSPYLINLRSMTFSPAVAGSMPVTLRAPSTPVKSASHR